MSGPVVCSESLRLLAHVLDELRAHDPSRKAGEILDLAGNGELPTGLVSIENERSEVSACGIDGRSEARASGADDDYISYV